MPVADGETVAMWLHRRRIAAVATAASALIPLGFALPSSAARPIARPHASIQHRGGQPRLQRRFDLAVRRIEALPYNTAYAPTGNDRAFAPATVPNDAPAEDYTSGSIPGSADSPAWPKAFKAVKLHSTDGAILTGELAIHPGRHPAVLVVHGFNTHGDVSVIRWAAMLAADGYDVLAADQRDFSAEYSAGYGYPKQVQTFGWKESQDVVTAGEFLRRRSHDQQVGIVGFSEGGQNTVLAMADDARLHPRHPIFGAGLTFSGPADQATQIDSTAQPAGCTDNCTYPATDALVALVVPPYTYTDVCTALSAAATRYHVSGRGILAREDGYLAQRGVTEPLLNFYAADDPLVDANNAVMMAGEERGRPLQQTLEIQQGQHAYYDDRWWQQRAILTYFAALLPHSAHSVSKHATVDRSPGGTPVRGQLVKLGHPSPKRSRSLQGGYPC